MNKLCHRVIFNKTRQMLMVVSDLAHSYTSGQVRHGMNSGSLPAAKASLLPLVLGISLALGLVSTPAQAKIVADNNSPGFQQPTVISSANGVPQVNIQTPNSDGVSRNQYSQFDVDQRGAILNNSGVNTKTDLGGLITANPWLAQGEAKIILNEVNSRNPSQLNGFIEVAGKRADVIIANPAGITCRGCGFINAKQTTLAAGQAILANGRLKGFEVDEGILTVGGKGLNDAKSDYTRLIARAVNINAKLHAQDLTVTTGHNRVDAQGNVDQVHASDTKKTAFSLDVAAIGGMYANKIKLVGTEQGVGVRNAGQLGAQAGNLTLSSEGQLTNSGMITASADVSLQHQGELANQGDITAGRDITVKARDQLDNQGRMLAGRHLDIQSAALKSQEKGVLAAGVDSRGNLTIRSGGELINSGAMKASADIILQNQGALTHHGDITAGQDITVKVRDSLNNQGRMLAGRHLDIQSAALTSQEKGVLAAGVDSQGKLTQTGNLSIHSSGVLNNSGMIAAASDVTLQNQGDFTHQGDMTAGGNISLQNQGNLTNQGNITSDQNITIKARDHLGNQGRIRAWHHLNIQSASLDSQKNSELAAGIDNKGKLTQPGNLTINSNGKLTNGGVIAASDVIAIQNEGDFIQEGTVRAGQGMTIKARNNLSNQGRMLAGRSLDIHSASLDSDKSGVLAAGVDGDGNLTIHSDSTLTNSGTMSASVDVTLRNQGNLTNRGDITSGQDITVEARDHLTNQGRVLAGRHLDIQSAALTSQEKGVLAAGVDSQGKLTQTGNLTIYSSGVLSNSGMMAAANSMTLQNQGNFTHQGDMTAGGNISLQNQGNLTNQGNITSGQNITVKTRDHLGNQGRMLAGHHLDIQSTSLDSQKNSELAAGVDNEGKLTQPGNLTINSNGKLINGGVIAASDVIAIQNEGDLIQEGTVSAGQHMTIKARDNLSNRGRMLAGRSLDIHSASLDSDKNGVLAAGVNGDGNLTIHSDSTLINSGTMSASVDMTLRNQGNLTNQGDITSGQSMVIKARDHLGNQGRILAGRHLDIQSASLTSQEKGVLAAGVDSQGKLTQTGNLTIRSDGALSNSGMIAAADDVVLKNQGDFIHQGEMTAGRDILLKTRDMVLKSRDHIKNQVQMLAGRHLDIQSASLDSQQNSVLAAGIDSQGKLTQSGKLTVNSDGKLTNRGVIMASDDIAIRNEGDLTQEGTVSAGQHMTIKARDNLNNQGKMLAGHNLNIQSASLDSQQEGVLAAGVDGDGNLTIHSDGILTNSGTMSASVDVTLQNQGNLTNQGEITSGQKIVIKARDHLSNQGKMLAGQDLDIQSASLMSQEKGVLAAGVDSQGKLSQSGNLTIRSDGALTNSGMLAATDDVTIQNQGNFIHQGEMTAGRDILLKTRDMVLKSRDYINNQVKVLAGRHLEIQSISLDSQQNSVLAAGVDSQGKLTQPGKLMVNSGGKLTNKGVITASDDLSIRNEGDLTQQGTVSAGQDIVIKTRDNLSNQGKILAGRNLDMQSASLDSQQEGVLAAGVDGDGNLTIHSDGILINSGSMSASIDVTLQNQGNLINQGDITAGQNITVKARDHLSNQGRMLAGRHLDIHSASLDSQKKGVLASGVDSQGLLIQMGSLAIRSDGKLTNNGVITASDDVTLRNQGDLTNQGEITAGQDVTIKTRDHINNQGRILAGRHLDSQSTSLHSQSNSVLAAGVDRYGKLIQTGNLTVKAREAVQLNGQNLAHDALSVEAKNVSLKGSQTVGDNLKLTSGAQLDLQEAKVSANQKLTLSAPALIDNQRGELSAETVTLSSQKLLNNWGRITQTGQQSLTLNHQAGIENNEGIITSNGQDLILKAKTIANRSGALAHAGKGVLGIDATVFDSDNSRLLSDGQLKLEGGDYHLDQSQISAREITIHIQSLSHQLGSMIQTGKQALTLKIQQSLDNSGGKIAGNGTVDIRANELNNAQGSIIASEEGQLQVNLDKSLNNRAGQLLASKGMTISASAVNNREGQIAASSGDMALTAQKLENQSGRVVGQQKLHLKTKGIDNEKGQIRAGKVELDTAQQRLNNFSGLIAAEKNLTLHSGELLNRHGLIQSGQNLTVNTYGNLLDNRDSGKQGGLFSQGAMRLNIGILNNQFGHIESHNSLSMTGEDVANQQGQILGGKNTFLTVMGLNNDQGLLQSGGKLTLKTQSLSNRNSGTQQGMTSKQALELETGVLDNDSGAIVSADSLKIKAVEVNNQQGVLVAQSTLDLHSQSLNNQAGRIQSVQALSVDIQGKGLNNINGVLDRQNGLSISSGDIINHNGTLHGKAGVKLAANQLDNQKGGKILSEDTLHIDAEKLLNAQGQLLALNHLHAKVKGHVDNIAGLVRSGGDIRLTAQQIYNANTQQSDKGIGGKNIHIIADTLDNSRGQLTATENVSLQLASKLNNTQGQLQANQQFIAQGKKLTFINTNGDAKAGQKLIISGESVTGDGKLRSLGDITLTLLRGFTHTGEIIANNGLTLDIQGDLINQSLISAATLQGRADTLINAATGKILGNYHQWRVQKALSNRGLMDGAQTYLQAQHLSNQGTGRIYGDHIALGVSKLDNLAEDGKSAVIAARNRLDIGANELNNKTHSLIYSDGDLSIGGRLNSQQYADGKGHVINNHSAGIEAAGDMRLAMANINNVNDHFETEFQQISQEPVKEYQVWGKRYNVKNHKITIDNDEVDHVCIDNMRCRDNFQIYQYTRMIKESRVKETDPAKILAGKNLIINTSVLTNDKSQVVAGGLLTVTGGRINNLEVQGEQHVTDKGRIEYFWRVKKRGRDRQGYSWDHYEPNTEIHAITLKPSTVQAQQGDVLLKGQRPDTFQGTATQITEVNNGQIDAGFVSSEVKVTEMGLKPGQRLEVVSQQPTVTGEKPIVIRTEVPNYRLPDNSLFKLKLPAENILLTQHSTADNSQLKHTSAQDSSLYKQTSIQDGDLLKRPQERDDDLLKQPSERDNDLLKRPLEQDNNLLKHPSEQDNNLFKQPPAQGNNLLKQPPFPDNYVLIETDPQFTQLKKWLGTDYMQRAMLSDRNHVHKRLGDGFYEQRLIREQIVNLTGKRYLPGYQNDEEQFKALMNAGLRAQKTFNLVPGIALSAEQMARLTEDMIWLVNTTVTLPDGSQQTVLVPQVYVRAQSGELDGSGALLSGSQVNLQLADDLLNQGRIIGSDIQVLADNIRQQGGHLQGNNLSLQARTDMVQRGGTISAKDFLNIQAGNNIDIASTTRSGENQAGSGRFSSTYVDNMAGIYVQGPDGKLHLQAGNDINLSAAQLATQGKNSEIRLTAGRDIQFDTVKMARYEHTAIGSNHRITRDQSGDVGTLVNSAGQIQVSAGRDVYAKAVDVTAGRMLQVSAGRDVNLLAGEQQQTYDEYHKVKGSNSMVSSTTTTTQLQFDRKQALSSTLSGDSVNVLAGKDITVKASNVVGTQDVALNAGNNLTVTTVEETYHQSERKEEKKSGLMGTGGIGFTVGSSKFKQTNDNDDVRHKGSTVGSSEGHVTLTTKNQVTLHGSDVVAGKDIVIQGKDTAITAAKNSHTELSKTEHKQSGLTLALSGTVGSAINTAVQTANEAKGTQDSRLQALKGTQAVLSGAQGYQAWQLSEAQSAKADAINQAGGKAEKPNDTIGIQLSYGSQSAKSETRRDATESQGSSLNAGRDIHITATGDKQTQDSGDIQVQGSALKAGRDIELGAKRDIVLESAENTQTTRGQNSSKGGSVGVGLTVGQGGTGVKFSASVNAGKGHEKGDGVTHTETQIDAGHQVTLKSGQDTLLKGAQVSGEKVTADVGRHLNLQSEQDRDNYDSKQENVSAGAGFTYGSMSGSASVNVSRDKMHSKFESVKEQTGIFAGKGGFDIRVGEHTQLDGAVIGSTADKDQNRLETGTLGFSDIQNKAEYKTEHQSVGMSTGGAVGSQMVSNLSSNMLSGTNHSDSKSSTTHAAVSDGTITVRDTDKQKQDIAGLSRDTENAANGLTPIFDKEKEQRRLAQAQAIANIGTQVMDIYNTQESITAMKKATEALKDPERQQALKQQAEAQLKQENGIVTAETIADRAYKIAYDGAIKGQGADIGGNRRQAVTAVVAALQGLAGGDIKAAIASGAAPYLSNAVKKVTYGDKAYEQLTPEEKATNVVAHAILGGVIAELKGGSAIAGSVGAAGGELAASVIAGALYPDKKLSELTADEKEKISNLSTLAGGIAAGLVTDSTAGGVDGAQTAKNAVENNYLHEDESRSFDKELAECKAKGGDCGAVIRKYLDTNNKNSAELEEKCKGGGITCVTYEEIIQANTNVALDEGSLQIRLSEKLKDPDAIKIVQYLNGKDLQFLKDNITTSDRVAAVALDPTSWPVMVFGAKAMIQGAKGKEQLLAAGITSGMNAAIQYGTTKEVKLSDLIGAGVVGSITAGKGYNPTVTWNAIGGYYTAEIKGDDPFLNAILSKGGASAGYTAGNVLKIPMEKIFNPISKQLEWEPIGIWTITKPARQSSVPSVAGNVGDSAVSGWFNSTVGGAVQEGKQQDEKK
ncbi:hemagglutinin repeat-containing protein [Photorhabdus luminescens]|uniref:hemagglutinin repeat-containing protein n=1 Tax=Photorhabdus luminescens TaxID=29488 RepID=UPI00223FD35B|nr:hemagglutinin repeat-containing protein [Photorhabdus luminescens]MCW7763098.1 hemagglutinin repeat-containing protein [Photorhabdus luminescens subsp. venezuelensis]